MISLPVYYLITPEFTGNIKQYLQSLEVSLQNGVRLVQLRSKLLPLMEYTQLAKNVLRVIDAYQARLILNAPEKLLMDIGAHGCHMSSERHIGLHERPIPPSYLLSLACHNRAQLIKAQQIKADLVTLSPVFATPSSLKGIPLGWEKFAEISNACNLPIFALGGVSSNHYNIAMEKGAYGIAAMRALWGLHAPLPTSVI